MSLPPIPMYQVSVRHPVYGHQIVRLASDRKTADQNFEFEAKLWFKHRVEVTLKKTDEQCPQCWAILRSTVYDLDSIKKG